MRGIFGIFHIFRHEQQRRRREVGYHRQVESKWVGLEISRLSWILILKKRAPEVKVPRL